MTNPTDPSLSASQLERLGEWVRSARRDVGDALFRVGDATYPFVAILEGEVAILDAAGNEIIRCGPVEVPGRAEPALGPDGVLDRGRDAAPALRRGRPGRPARVAVRGRSAQRPAALDLHRPARSPAAGPGHRPRDRGAALVRGDDAAARLRSGEPPALHLARPRTTRRRRRPRLARSLPLVRLPGGGELAHPSNGEVSARSESAASSAPRRRSTCSWSAPARRGSAPPSTAPPRGSTRSSSRAPRSAARRDPRAGSRTTSASRPGSAASS